VRGDDGALELTGATGSLDRRGGVARIVCPTCGAVREWVPYATLSGRAGRG
jgi:hypothetical protein